MKQSEREAWGEFLKERGMPQRPIPAGVPVMTSAEVWASVEGWPGITEPAKLGHHGNRATLVDGIKFQSKLEADRYRELKLLQASGEVWYFLRQVPFDVAPGVIYRLDFFVVWRCIYTGQFPLTYEDTKGHMTDASRIKIARVQERYRIEIKILRRADVRKF
jgi:hypothetical protein